MKLILVLSVAANFFSLIRGGPSWLADERPEKWNKLANEAIQDMLNRELNSGVAKNLILFLG